MDNYNYPAGSDTPNAPWNEKEPMMKKCEDCDGEGIIEGISSCCGAEPSGNGDNDSRDYGVCPDCGDHCEYEQKCETCSGSGEIQMSAEEVKEHESNVACMKKHGFVP